MMIVSEKSHQNIFSFYFKKLNKIKKGIISNEKMIHSANYIHMIMFTRSSVRIFNPTRYTGYIYDYTHSFFGKDF